LLTTALQAVQAAIDKQVHIISMSWTIKRTDRNKDDILELENAIDRAAHAGILMFCSASDQGATSDDSFPASARTKHIFKIGAAEASGVPSKVVNLNDVDFIFPGHNVVKKSSYRESEEPLRPLSGSSVATAIAAGFAALVLYCVQLGALNTIEEKQQERLGDEEVTMRDYEDIKGHERMKQVFISQSSGAKFLEVWHVFGLTASSEKAKRLREDPIDTVTKVARRLKTTKTLK
jgi:hypothetical protein